MQDNLIRSVQELRTLQSVLKVGGVVELDAKHEREPKWCVGLLGLRLDGVVVAKLWFACKTARASVGCDVS